MLSIFSNGAAILIGAATGSLIGGKLSYEFKDLLNKILGLSVLTIAIATISEYYLKNEFTILYIILLLLGAIIGKGIDIQKKIDNGLRKLGDGDKTAGLISGISLLCIGMLPIMGPLQAALQKNHTLLHVNTVFAFTISLTLSSSYGYIIALTAPILIGNELLIFFFSKAINQLMGTMILNEMSLIGGILMLANGLNTMNFTKISIFNLLPSLFLPILLNIWL